MCVPCGGERRGESRMGVQVDCVRLSLKRKVGKKDKVEKADA